MTKTTNNLTSCDWFIETNFPRTPAFRVVQPQFPGSQVLDTIVVTDDEHYAHLFAAAPKMLATLKLMHQCLLGKSGESFRDMHPATWLEIEIAISKAEGDA